MGLSTVILCTIILFLLYIFYLSVNKFGYWKKQNVPYVKPLPLLGNYGEYILMKTFLGEVVQKLCRKFPNEPYFGAFFGTEPALIIRSSEIIKLIFTKDFYYFSAREIPDYTHMEVGTQNLFWAHGDQWKLLRQNLTPLFTSTKMKNMFHLIEKCGHTLENMLNEESSMSDVIEAKSLMIRFTMDCIGSCVFGIETHTMMKTKDMNPFLFMGGKIFVNSPIRNLKRILRTVWPKIFYGLGLEFFPTKLHIFFYQLLIGVFQNRDYKPTSRQDFVDLVLAFKKNNHIAGESLNPKSAGDQKIKIEVTDDLLVSQCILFFAAGFETSANTLAFALYELAKDQKSQQRAQAEVDEYLHRHDNKLVYECVYELPYIEACLNETMRLNPVTPIITREVIEDYTFPNGLKVNKGVRIHLPVYDIHRDPNNFVDPDSFHPERFYQEAKNDVKPQTFFPFGEGRRQCIGYRFAKMQTSVALITILKKYNIELAEGTPAKMEFSPATFLTYPKNTLNLKFTLRDGWKQREFC